MIDFNHCAAFGEIVTGLIDTALVAEEAASPPRQYLGGSRLGVACERALQFEYAGAPRDPGRGFDGKILRIFAAGHLFEELAIRWLRAAGFNLAVRKKDGGQFGFSVAKGRIQGHVDGILTGGPLDVPMGYPALWECKSLNDKSWKDTVKRGVAISKPVYASQIATYQAYMETAVPGITANPALFTAINKNTAELHFELVPFDAALAQRMTDRAVRVLQATEAGELLPRITRDPSHFECRFCDWQDRCWRLTC
ncbi:MAG: hypothetical protein HQL76_06105 [Magnetococcales bacterium]|nr:hypothetical protein [Magnetococcales bacterium]